MVDWVFMKEMMVDDDLTFLIFLLTILSTISSHLPSHLPSKIGGLNYPLISDVTKSISNNYGVLNRELGEMVDGRS